MISSHYVFFDPATTAADTIQGTVTFDNDVLGIITTLTNLNASDFLGAPGTSYNSPSLRGLESIDSVGISALDTISLNFSAGSPGDYIRVITLSTVPIPPALPLFASALALLCLWRRAVGARCGSIV